MEICPRFELIKENINTGYAPLCVLGEATFERQILHKLREFDLIKMKQHNHPPGEKLMDAFLLILSGYQGLNQINTTLRKDPMVAQSWHRTEGIAEQSNISRTLDACDEKAVSGLKKLSQEFWEEHTQVKGHDWRRSLVVDLDLTPLPASANAQGSKKGYFAKKTKRADN